MVDLMALEKQFLSAHIREGVVAVDFTMGNGHDTLFLSKAIGESGRLYAFDIQDQALANTRARLEENGCFENYTLIQASHSLVKDYVKEKFDVGVFNLGYLPGGDKRITTLRETTLPAVDSALELLNDGGIILIAVYPGHAEGEIEGKLLTERLSTLDRKQICVSRFTILNSPTSPYFIAVEKK
jgi:methylase of polypeptide subunit release factors